MLNLLNKEKGMVTFNISKEEMISFLERDFERKMEREEININLDKLDFNNPESEYGIILTGVAEGINVDNAVNYFPGAKTLILDLNTELDKILGSKNISWTKNVLGSDISFKLEISISDYSNLLKELKE